jgi:putative Mg2+ transporter-C (MgtC) family protein
MELETVLILILAMLLGGMIGWARERDGKPAGLRTHILVCVGCAMLMATQVFITRNYPGSDPGRIAAGVITGIGFLGAGAIMQSGGEVKGVTTAASVWITAAIGIAVGLGYYWGALVCTLVTLFVIETLREFERKFFSHRQKSQ